MKKKKKILSVRGTRRAREVEGARRRRGEAFLAAAKWSEKWAKNSRIAFGGFFAARSSRTHVAFFAAARAAALHRLFGTTPRAARLWREARGSTPGLGAQPFKAAANRRRARKCELSFISLGQLLSRTPRPRLGRPGLAPPRRERRKGPAREFRGAVSAGRRRPLKGWALLRRGRGGCGISQSASGCGRGAFG